MNRDGAALHAALVDLFTALCGALPNGSCEDRGGYMVVSYPRVPIPIYNSLWSGTDDSAAAAALPGELERIRATGAPPGVFVVDDQGRALREEALRLGLTDTETMPAMLVRPNDFRGDVATAMPVEIGSAQGTDELIEAREVFATGCDLPSSWFSELYTDDVVSSTGSTVYVAREGARAVSTAWSLRQGDAVGIIAVATPEADRGRGFAAAVTARAVADGFASGARFAYLQSSALGFSVYRRLGFEQVSTYRQLWSRRGSHCSRSSSRAVWQRSSS